MADFAPNAELLTVLALGTADETWKVCFASFDCQISVILCLPNLMFFVCSCQLSVLDWHALGFHGKGINRCCYLAQLHVLKKPAIQKVLGKTKVKSKNQTTAKGCTLNCDYCIRRPYFI